MSSIIRKKNERFTPDLKEAREKQAIEAWSNKVRALERRITDGRTYLLMRHHFFGRIALRLKFVWTDRIPTMAITADMVCYMNPDFAEKLNLGELAFLLAHEISHIGYMHFDRIGDRDPDLWNYAGDYMINAMLLKAGLPMPVLDDRWKDHPYYQQMVKEAEREGHNYMGLFSKRHIDKSDIQIYEELWEERRRLVASGACCSECGQTRPAPERGQSQSQQGDNNQQPSGTQPNSAGGQEAGGQQQAGSGQGGNDDSTQQGGSVRQEGAGPGTQMDGGSGRAGDSESHSQGASAESGSEAGDDGQDRAQGRGSGQQAAQGAAGGQGSGTCKTCGQQKPQLGGWGTGRGDADFGATEQLKRDAQEGRGERVLTPDQIRDILIAAATSAKAAGRGAVPAEFERWIAELRDPKLPWNHILRRWVSSVLVSGQSYRRPSRSSGALVQAARLRGLAGGVRPILPGPKPDLQPVVIGVDVSGSRSEEDLRDDLSEVFGVLKRYPNPTRVIVWDAAVHFDDYVRSVDEVNLVGGGGTATEPMFEAIEEDPGRWGPPAAAIVFTDGMASYPEKAPPYPVLWVWTGKGEIPRTPPFGEVIAIDHYGMSASFATDLEPALLNEHDHHEPAQPVRRSGRGR